MDREAESRPKSERGIPRHLDPKIKLVWSLPAFVALLTIWLVVLLGLELTPGDQIFFNLHETYWILISFLVFIPLAGGITYFYHHLEYVSFTYELGEKEIIIRQGVFTRQTTVIPYLRIQNINTERNVLERLLGMASLHLDTAGANINASEAHLPGVSRKDELIREIMDRAEKAKKEVEGTENGLGEIEQDLRSERALLAEILKELVKLNSGIHSLNARLPAHEPRH